jgi:hypothetical protein
LAIDNAAARRFRAQIRDILNRDWNPIGSDDLPDDEYDGYVGKVAAIINGGGSDAEITAYLTWAEAEHIGYGKADTERLARVIAKVRALGRMQ